ncbi:phosphatase PAP2 family protein [Sinomonas sp. ASV486]|uniref:phosphatase PAP2 family protein n=1 Tax=Sinomonas sp. ASV486 TaxID=3051170 RepID=UPI0027DBF930|nr:phosphatase PAP2 family protein [Sinomonas sp. ASV486]MDQ4490418.1 phosphatase PAP2 family protein [Sinomonas sp. ASV486]
MTASDHAKTTAGGWTQLPIRSRLLRLPTIKHWIVVPIAMSIVLLALGFASTTPSYQNSELAINQWMSTQHVGWMNAVALALEQILGPRGAIVILVLLLIVLWFVRRTPVDAIAVVTVTGFGWVYSLIFKYAVHRHRPDPNLLANPLSPDMDPNSFPSGHVCFAVSLTIALYFLFRHTKWGTWVLVVGLIASAFVAWTRVYVGVHYPMDVVASFPASIAGVFLWSGVWNRIAPPILNRLPFISRLESR